MEEIIKHINDTNASYRSIGAGNAKNTDLFLDNEHYDLFRNEGERITVRLNKENLQKAILFIASILPRKYDNSSTHETVQFSTSFIYEQLAILDAFFTIKGKAVETRTQEWEIRKDVLQKNGKIDNRFYLKGLLSEEVSYTNYQGLNQTTKFTIRNYLAGGYSDLHIKKGSDGIFDVWVTNVLKPYYDKKDCDTDLNILQQIFYGAPGTGKSFKIKECTQGDDSVIRTTFHPDSDYSTFVGCYKPTMGDPKPIYGFDANGNTVEAKVSTGAVVKERKIEYKFVQQAFTKAYIRAWKKMGDTSLWTKKVTATPPTGGTATPYKMTGKKGVIKVFARPEDDVTLLNDAEKNALLEVDNFDFPFDAYDNFGKLRAEKGIKVVVTNWPSSEQKDRYKKTITLTAAQIRELVRKFLENRNIYWFLESLLAKILEKLGLKWSDLDKLKDYDGEDLTVEVEESNSLLGMYVSDEKTVYLFKENIGNDMKLLCATYIHEMFHAYYDSGNRYIPEIEEPIVECNTLCFLELFDDKKTYLSSYKNSVERKQSCIVINFYGFGAHLYENRSLDWMRLYQNAYNYIDDTSTIVSDYKGMFSPIYPFGEEEGTRNLLYMILKNIKATSPSGFSKADQFLIIEEINRGNCAQIFGDLFQLLDRKDGYSEYPIEADEDLRKELENEFVGLKLDAAVEQKINSIFEEDYPDGITDKILNGELLVLPKNLFIWATMNTSDQSLFPIDSAFKRRWDWKYIKITEGKNKETQNPLKWKILIEDEEADKVRLYDWWDFLQEINKIIYRSTESADKQMGYFFTKATEHLKGEIVEVIEKNNRRSEQNPAMDIEVECITAETFVNKVLFYLWTDVMKDNEYEEITNLVRKDGNLKLMFPDFFDETGEYPNHENLRLFLDNVMKESERAKWCDVCEVSLEAPKDTSRWFRPNSIIFKITDNPQDPGDLYNRAKEAWSFDVKRANPSVTKNVYIYVAPLKRIVACYEVSKWYEKKDSNGKIRFGFDGTLVDKDDMIGSTVDKIAHARGGVVFYPENLAKK